MWFLLIQIFFFMLIAAALGAALAWWWLRRRFVDVTETHAELTRQVETAIGEGRVLKREDIDASLTAALSAYKPPQPDFEPIQDRLLKLEQQFAAPDPDMGSVKDRIGSIEQTVSTISASIASLRSIHLEALDQNLKDVATRIDNIQMPDVESVNTRVLSLAETVSANRPNLSPLEQRIGALENLISNFRVPEVDLGPVHSGLARLDLSLSELQPPEVDLRPLEARLSQLEELLAGLDQKEAVSTAISTVSGDIANLFTELSALSQEVLNLSSGLASVTTEVAGISGDVSGISGEVAGLSSEVAGFSKEVSGISGDVSTVVSQVLTVADRVTTVSREVSAVGQAVSRIEIPEPADLDPVHNRLAEIDASLMDRFAAIHERIAATTPLNDALIGTLAAIEADLEVVASRRGPDMQPLFAQISALDASLSDIRNDARTQTRFEAIDRRLTHIQEVVQTPPVNDVRREDLIALEDRLNTIEYGISALQQMLRARIDLYQRPEPAPEPRPAPPPPPPPPAIPAAELQALTARRAEAIAVARRPDDQANLLTHAAFGNGDDLALIVGVGPILTELLHEVGVYYFWQIAEWTDEDVAYVDDKLLHFKGRIERDDWVGQSKTLAEMPGSAPRPGAH